ncbi:hypothetical protein C8F04DRAFT_1127548 [Mycena alexandri]|uniref:DUF7918 domain-containing protein n=1 Tax=Mycena alexandri TaxID=1745969 RepID=A0AAD6WUG0_9AGAR|nr:hypothetical protein C8F04DRAFT_1127548 [Mycena alexandri]
MPDLGRFSCWVEVDGARLKEYSLEYSADGTEATCWIPSEVDKEFSVHWTDSNSTPSRTIYGYVKVDGMDCGGYPLLLVRAGGRWLGTGHRDSVSVSPTTRRSLLFGRQQFTDDDRFLDTSISPDLGTICPELDDVFVYRTPPMPRQYAALPSNAQKLHERSKKATGHSVQFGTEFRRYVPLGARIDITNTVAESLKRLAKFTFKYRPIDLLKANGIAPPDPPRPVPRPAAIEVIPDEDEEVIASKIKALQDQLAAIRKKTQRPVTKVKKEIKVEKSIFLPGEVIDLT